jgi:hypothetical protein
MISGGKAVKKQKPINLATNTMQVQAKQISKPSSASFDANKRAIDSVVARFFAVFTNKNGKTPNLVELKSICLPHCMVVKTCGESPVVYDLSGFIAPRKKLLNDGELVEFSEEELWERTDIFGNIAQRFSVYEKSGVLLGDRFETKGMKSIQLINTKAGWKISSVAWDDERTGTSVPSEYGVA